jgi:hypothetical protein
MWLDYKGQRHFLPTGMPEEPNISGFSKKLQNLRGKQVGNAEK